MDNYFMYDIHPKQNFKKSIVGGPSFIKKGNDFWPKELSPQAKFQAFMNSPIVESFHLSKLNPNTKTAQTLTSPVHQSVSKKRKSKKHLSSIASAVNNQEE